MKRSRKQPGRSGPSKLAIAATMLAVPLALAPRPGLAQGAGKQVAAPQGGESRLKYADIYFKWHEQYSIAGVDQGRTIYQNSKGDYFYLDPATGDMKFLPAAMAAKWGTIVIKGQSGREAWAQKVGGKVTILGIDQQGRVVQKNPRGEKFYLDPAGNIVYVK